jgi:hypothetical protein
MALNMDKRTHNSSRWERVPLASTRSPSATSVPAVIPIVVVDDMDIKLTLIVVSYSLKYRTP